MKLVKTFGRGKAAAEALIEALERRGSLNTAKVEKTVTAIVTDVRKRGDAALRKYAAKFDGLSEGCGAAGLARGDEGGVGGDGAGVAGGDAGGAGEYPGVCGEAEAGGVDACAGGGRDDGADCAAAGERGLLCAGRALSAAVDAADDGDAGAGGGSGADCGVLAEAGAGDDGGGVAGGRDGVLSRGRSAGDCGDGVWDGRPIARGEQDCGAGEFICDCGEDDCVEECGIDMPAGPTEIVVTSETGDAAGIAADLVAQAEHDPEALAVLITSNAALAEAVKAEVKVQAKDNAIAKQSLAAQGCIFVTESVAEARELTNRLAPEHLTVDAAADLKWVKNAGSVFVGDYSPQSMGDYVSGPNHVLPTGRVGRVRGGLSVMDFVKVITVQEYTRKGLRALGPHAIALAEAEGLKGHAESVRVRMR